MRHDKATMNYQRKILATMGFFLPVLCVLTGFLAYERNAPDFWYSISATFYATSNICMIGVLAIFGFFLFTYKGYDIGDSVTCKFSGAMALGILIFPCECSAAEATTGIFNLPTGISHVIHCIIAALLFASFVYMIGFRFTKSDKPNLTRLKRKRNRIYVDCAVIIGMAMVSQVMTSIVGIPWMTIVNETVMLWGFSLAWLVKSDGIKRLND